MKNEESIKNKKTNKTEKFISIPVMNAGIVLMQSFINTLFDRLGLLEDGKFNSDNAQQKAIYCIHFLATGQKSAEEYYLVLNKVICGLAIDKPVVNTIDFKDSDIELMEGLIKAMIDYWPAIGRSSIDGFRGNWLVREGILREKADGWDLIVEKRAYDILIQRAPFPFSVIKYNWMDKPLYVTWNY